MDIIEKSLQIALTAYSGKKDKAGKTYILHPLRVMSKMSTEIEMAVALLHDVIEDSSIDAEALYEQGLPAEVVDAVVSLTRLKNESYTDFIQRVLKNPLAAKVKKADIEDNINILRLRSVTQQDLQRIAKYHNAWLLLKQKIDSL